MTSVSDTDSTMKSDCSQMASLQSNTDQNTDLQEYETQHFGFTPKSFANGIYNAIVEYLREGIDVMEQYINQEFSEIMTENQVKEATSQMLPLLVKKLDRSFDFLEKYLTENVFHIPENVVLPEDEVQMTAQYTKEDDDKINQENEHLRDKIIAIKYANSKLQQELYDIEIVQTKFDMVLKQMQKLQNIAEDSGVSDTKDTMLYTIDNLKKLIDMTIVKSINQPA